MYFDNNPAVGLETRRWLKKAQISEMVDDEGVELITRSIDHCKRIHPGGMVLDTAISLGADPSAALVAGSIAEMFYSVCSLTDDIQDNETQDYLGDVSPAVLINVQSQLLCLIAVRTADLLGEIGPQRTQDLIVEIYRTGAKMLTGQQYEIIKNNWDATVYKQVAELSAGEQFALYMRLAAVVAGNAEEERFARLGRVYGTLLQYVIDSETADPRLDIIEPIVLSNIKGNLAADLFSLSLSLVKEGARRPFDGLLRRCNSAPQ